MLDVLLVHIRRCVHQSGSSLTPLAIFLLQLTSLYKLKNMPKGTQRLLQGGCGALICPSEQSRCYMAVAGLFTAHANTAAVTGRLRGSHMPK